ncbi:MAG: alpha/beta hydrolase [Aeromicrobium erythreum]
MTATETELAVAAPSAVLEDCPPPSARSVVTAVRTAHRIMATSAEDAGRHSAPPQWDDEHGERATHLMTATADGVRTDAAALTVGLGALEEFCDRLDVLRPEHESLTTRRAALVRAASSSTLTDPDAIRTHNHAVEVLDTAVRDWNRRLHAAEDRLVPALASADTVAEAVSIARAADDVTDLRHDLTTAVEQGPTAVAVLWAGLAPAAREALLAAVPTVLGRTDGLPASVRDQANRLVLGDDLRDLRGARQDGTLTDAQRDLLERAEAVEQALARADRYVDPRTGDLAGAQLYVYDPRKFGGDGAVAIAVGDLDTAEHVATRVPGITTDILDTPTLTQEATNLYESARTAGPGTVASMAWLDYDAPDAAWDPATLTEGRAEDGGRRLADALDGLRASRPDPAHLTVIGHSYGSTTVGYALSEHDPDVDDVVVAGSPGLGADVDRAGDLGVDAGHVYVARNSRDPRRDARRPGGGQPRQRRRRARRRPQRGRLRRGPHPRRGHRPRRVRELRRPQQVLRARLGVAGQHRPGRRRSRRRRHARAALVRPVVGRAAGPGA